MNLLLNIRAKYCFLRANGVYYNCQQKGVDRMARNTTNISIRMDADLKAQADALFTELGMNLTTAFNIFVRQSLREGGIPFEVRLELTKQSCEATTHVTCGFANGRPVNCTEYGPTTNPSQRRAFVT